MAQAATVEQVMPETPPVPELAAVEHEVPESPHVPEREPMFTVTAVGIFTTTARPVPHTIQGMKFDLPDE